MKTEWRALFLWTRSHILSVGVAEESADDCALAFLEKMLLTNPIAQELPEESLLSSVCLRRCAVNFAKNFRRAEARRQGHECTLSLASDDTPLSSGQTDSTGIHDPLLRSMQSEFWRRVAAALAQLTPMQREVFLRHCLYGESVAELAAAMNKMPHAISQVLFRARQRLRVVLERQGMTEAQLREYLSPPLAISEAQR